MSNPMVLHVALALLAKAATKMGHIDLAERLTFVLLEEFDRLSAPLRDLRSERSEFPDAP